MNDKVNLFIKGLKHWQPEVEALRSIILKTSLEENFKWRLPCYSYEESNVAIIQPFKNYVGLMFFKGALLRDDKKLLIDNGPNSQSAKRFEFRDISEVKKYASQIKAYIREAIEIEKSGKKVKTQNKLQLPQELKEVFSKNKKLEKAFNSLTPGRKRAYAIHFSSAKQPATRLARIKKCAPKILKGKGFNEP